MQITQKLSEWRYIASVYEVYSNFKIKRMWNPFAKKTASNDVSDDTSDVVLSTGTDDDAKKKKKTSDSDVDDLTNQPGMPKMNMVQRMAMKKIQKMKPEERENLMKKMLSPENIQKNRKQILEYLDQMEKSGQMNKHQIGMIKKQLGLY